MKTKIEFEFGTEFKSDGSRLDYAERSYGLAVIRTCAVELFGGCNLVNTMGDWLDPDTNKVVREGGATLAVLAELLPARCAERVNTLVQVIKVSLCQKAVAVTRYAVNFEII